LAGSWKQASEKSKQSSLAGSKDKTASSQVWLEARIREKQAVKFGWKQGSEKSKPSSWLEAGSKDQKAGSQVWLEAGSKDQRKASSQVWLEARVEQQAVKFGWKQGSAKSKQSSLAGSKDQKSSSQVWLEARIKKACS